MIVWLGLALLAVPALAGASQLLFLYGIDAERFLAFVHEHWTRGDHDKLAKTLKVLARIPLAQVVHAVYEARERDLAPAITAPAADYRSAPALESETDLVRAHVRPALDQQRSRVRRAAVLACFGVAAPFLLRVIAPGAGLAPWVIATLLALLAIASLRSMWVTTKSLDLAIVRLAPLVFADRDE